MPRNNDLQKRIEEQAKKLEQERARLKQLQARQSREERTRRNRLMILAGAVVMNKADKDEAFKAQLWRWLDEGLIRDVDRVPFNLPPRNVPAEKKGPTP